jgi:DNA-binding NarL/FixJ family response regulator
MKWERELVRVTAPLCAQPGFSVVGTQTDSYQALKLAEDEQPDVAIIGYYLDHSKGLDFVPLIRNKCPGLGIILFSPYDDPGHARSALTRGVGGYLVWKSDMNILTSAIDMVFKGGFCVSPQITVQVFRKPPVPRRNRGIASFMMARRSGAGGAHSFFSGTEWRIIALIVRGKNTKEIAEGLSLKNGTVRNYISILMRKTRSTSRLQIINFALGFILDHSIPENNSGI